MSAAWSTFSQQRRFSTSAPPAAPAVAAASLLQLSANQPAGAAEGAAQLEPAFFSWTPQPRKCPVPTGPTPYFPTSPRPPNGIPPTCEDLQDQILRCCHRPPRPRCQLRRQLPGPPAAVPRQQLELGGRRPAGAHQLAGALHAARIHPLRRFK